VINVIVEIHGYFIEKEILIGKTCSISELRQKLEIAKKHCTAMSDITSIFCRLFQFEQLSSQYEEGVFIDFVIDTDIDHIYKPR
jgi:hypothetical protein